jgi:hypothetical protein
MQAAEFPTIDLAERCEEELRALIAAYVRFEATDPDPWSGTRVPPPLAAFGERHGIAWPLTPSSRFLTKGSFEEVANLLRVDRMVFFWAGGFDLGGDTLRAILTKLGATAAVGEGNCHLAIRHDDPTTRANELGSFLIEEQDCEGQFTIEDGTADTYFSITFIGANARARLAFDDSGVQDWAFTAALPELKGEDPRLLR